MRTIGLVLLSIAIMALLLTDADAKRRTFAAAQTAKQQCINTCRVRHRSCLSAKQLPSLMCLGIYQIAPATLVMLVQLVDRPDLAPNR